jgi:NADPH-dependent glutamate synthase beta subunit-like oxidoreductase
MRMARECEYCERPGCTAACPAGIDMRNVMRRLEAGNMAGAARLLRETNPLAEICGYLCKPNPPCEAHCNRLTFSEYPVRIADLQAWISQRAGAKGWPAVVASTGKPIAVVGAGPAGLTCAYYLARVGCRVVLMDREQAPGAELRRLDAKLLPPDAAERDIQGAMAAGIEFMGGLRLGVDASIQEVAERNAAVFLATGAQSSIGHEELGLQKKPEGYWVAGNVFAGGSLMRGECSTVQAVADGRRAAQAIHRMVEPSVGSA